MCADKFSTLTDLQQHKKSCHSKQHARKRPLQHGAGSSSSNPPRTFNLVENSLNGAAQTYRLPFTSTGHGAYVNELNTAVLFDAHHQIEQLSRDQNVKWYLTLAVVFHRAVRPDILTDPPIFFRTEAVASTSSNPLDLQLKVALRRLWQEIDTYEENGSGWVIDHRIQLDIHVVAYDPLRANQHFKLPKWLVNKRSVLNIQNHDEDW